MPVLLASADLDAAGAVLDGDHRSGRALLIPTAAEPLADGPRMTTDLRRRLIDLGIEVVEVDADGRVLDQIERDIAAVVVGPGDPFHLLGTIRGRGIDDRLRRAVAAGVPYVGVSAGAMIAGPSIEPVIAWSPFDAPPTLDRRGVGLVDTVVLAHRDRDDRAERLPGLLAAAGESLPVVALADDQSLVVDASGTRLWSVGAQCWLREATTADAGDVAETFCEAAEAAWSGFLDALPRADEMVGRWRARIAGLTPPERFVVAERRGRVVGFVWVRPATGADAGPGRGLVETFYTRPSVWRSGIGRLLMTRAVDLLTAAGFTEAVLWTESRNDGPLAVYDRLGWRPDGTTRERDYLGSPLRELRLARPLLPAAAP